MNPNGKQVKRLTHTKVDPLLQGLFPTAWSANGKRLLAEFGGQDTSYAVARQPPDRRPEADRSKATASRASSAPRSPPTARTVLGYTGGFEPGPSHDVATVPYGGGKAEGPGQERLRTRLELA